MKKALNAGGVKEKLYEGLNIGRQGLHRARFEDQAVNGIDLVYDGGFTPKAA